MYKDNTQLHFIQHNRFFRITYYFGHILLKLDEESGANQLENSVRGLFFMFAFGSKHWRGKTVDGMFFLIQIGNNRAFIGVTSSLTAVFSVSLAGYVFCMLHRLPEQHDCLFDHLGRGREEAVLKMVKLDRKVGRSCQRIGEECS